jgi:hypothetical protein
MAGCAEEHHRAAGALQDHVPLSNLVCVAHIGTNAHYLVHLVEHNYRPQIGEAARADQPPNVLLPSTGVRFNHDSAARARSVPMCKLPPAARTGLRSSPGFGVGSASAFAEKVARGSVLVSSSLESGYRDLTRPVWPRARAASHKRHALANAAPSSKHQRAFSQHQTAAISPRRPMP